LFFFVFFVCLFGFNDPVKKRVGSEACNLSTRKAEKNSGFLVPFGKTEIDLDVRKYFLFVVWL